ncbi:MAG: DUF4349 domain-containing protein [Oscillospiraceae bacterium]
MKKLVTILLAMVLSMAIFCGCGSKSTASDGGVILDKNFATNDSVARPEPGGEVGEMPAVPSDGPTSDNTTGNDIQSNEIFMPANRKIILNANLTVEALEFAETKKAILSEIEKTGGYIQSSTQSGRDDDESIQNAEITARIPTSKYSQFLTATEKAGNIVYKQEYTDDVTATYMDTEARLKSLNIEEERLLEILKTATDLESIIALEARLSDVRYEIENFTATKRNLDNQIEYSTVNISVQEVKTFTETPKDTFPSRVWQAIKGSAKGFVSAVQGIIIEVIYLLPALVILGVIILVIILAVKKRRKKIKKAEKEMQNKTDEIK